MENEIFTDVQGFEGVYQIGTHGTVISLERNGSGPYTTIKTILKPSDETYKRVTLTSDGHIRRISIHKLVAEHFVKNIDNKPFINHIDGHKHNNHYSNLEWCTASENSLHAYRIGLQSAVGSKNNKSKLTEDAVVEIKHMLRDGKSQSSIANIYDVCRACIYLIATNKNWSHVVI